MNNISYDRRPTLGERVKTAVYAFRQGFPFYPFELNRQLPANIKQSPFIFPDFRADKPHWRMTNIDSYLAEGFNLNSIIYSAVMFKAKQIVQAPLRAYTGDIDNPELLPAEHPLSRLCKRPNPDQSWAEFIMAQEIYLNITGDAFTYFERPSESGLPTAMYALNPVRTWIVPSNDPEQPILGFLYVPEGKTAREGTPFLPQDISHVKLPNPSDELDGYGYGLSPISALARSADVDNMITRFLQVFFEKGAMVTGAFSFEDVLHPKTAEDIQKRFTEKYGGVDNAHKVMILDHGAKYQRVGLTFEEMGFNEQDQRNETRILAPFGVPAICIGSRVGLERSTYSNYEEARRSVWEDTLTSELRLFEDDLQYYLGDETGNTFVLFDFKDVPALRMDLNQKIQAWKDLVQNRIPLDIASKVVGLDLGELPDDVLNPPKPDFTPNNDDDDDEDDQTNVTNEERALLRIAEEMKRANDLLERSE